MRVLWGITIGIALLMIGTSIALADPPPTPTLLPLAPSPTSGAIYLRPTPTLIPTAGPAPYDFDPSNTGGQLADNAINLYRYFNINHVFDFGGYIIVGYFILRYLVRNIGDSTKDL